ncbi:hypothetical protein [Dyadobacter psychrotolerans]|uniref:Uncharacterized protein n=1 Tax=Dyadobacter psychrotolerans TaxID=2541721 RepID=A0A4V2Z4X3_9BACT|nr:hypothetical protein [Dyadobacter psychrotolerans]TDE17128.1 hypothetical protein E0F88_04285 [Dyadobacter psychrotolerans]
MTRFLKLNFLILTVITSALSSCGQTSNSKNKPTKKLVLKNYFDSRDQILFRLYKKNTDGVSYWETWNNDDKTAVVHWGIMGTYGEQRTVSSDNISNLKDSINSLIADKIKEGFSEISNEKQFTLAITFKLKTWGTTEDLDIREKYRNFITEHLGWTGNGRCDDGDIGSGEMTLYADVVDPYLAIKTIPGNLLRNNVIENYYFTISQGNKTIAENILPASADKH